MLQDAETIRRPLVLSLHGQPGTGKTLSHQLLARALYNADPKAAKDGCDGSNGPRCPAYFVRSWLPML